MVVVWISLAAVVLVWLYFRYVASRHDDAWRAYRQHYLERRHRRPAPKESDPNFQFGQEPPGGAQGPPA